MPFILALAGVVIGIIGSHIFQRHRSMGVLHIDDSDPIDDAYMFLEIKKSVGNISDRKRVVFTIKKENFIPHE